MGQVDLSERGLGYHSSYIILVDVTLVVVYYIILVVVVDNSVGIS